jgi:hypothetical protein
MKPLTPQEIAAQLNQWFLGGQGRVTQLPGAAHPSTRKFYANHRGYDLAIPQGTQLNLDGLEYIGHGESGGYGNRLAAYDPKMDRTYYFSHLSNVQRDPTGKMMAWTGGKPGTRGAGNTTGAHLDIEFAQGRQGFNYSKAIQRPMKSQGNSQDRMKQYLSQYMKANPNSRPLAIGTRRALEKQYGPERFKQAIRVTL